MNDNKVLWFLIYLIITCTFIWGVGAFIAWDMSWFYNDIVGRIIALILFGIAIRSSAELVDTF